MGFWGKLKDILLVGLEKLGDFLDGTTSTTQEANYEEYSLAPKDTSQTTQNSQQNNQSSNKITEYYDAFINNVVVGGVLAHTDLYETYGPDYSDYNIISLDDKPCAYRRTKYVSVPECPPGAYDLQIIMDWAESSADSHNSLYDYSDRHDYFPQNGDSTHLFLNKLWDNSTYFKEVVSQLSDELFEDYKLVRSTIDRQHSIDEREARDLDK
ncbi:MAG: hypothetical protein K2K31_00615 [Clostridia bacterium]|nr:hypothetical protein [Clostridia bacterium]